MALPPEQINIKRRREEEPVETLYIQDAMHRQKRRFTDYFFQRVTKTISNEVPIGSAPSTPSNPAAQRVLRTPRSVSSLQATNRRTAQSVTSGVPSVRATSPGAEFREAQKFAAVKKEIDEKRKKALQSSSPRPSSPAPKDKSFSSRPATPDNEVSSGVRTPFSNRTQSVRRFQITRSSGSGLGSLRGSSGIQKRRDGPAPGVAVLMEQLRRPLSRQASAISDLVTQAEMDAESGDAPTEERPRKRPVVNKAEKKWREDRQTAISAAKTHINETLEKSAQAHQSTWEEESERLAREFERVALEIEHDMEIEDRREAQGSPAPVQLPHTATPKKPLKYQPKAPKLRAAENQKNIKEQPQTEVKDYDNDNDNDNDGDFVYDVYIRRPIAEKDMLTNPLAELESDIQLRSLQAANSGIGVIVITAEDEEYWENFVEGDEEEWDSEDADSNAENNPANDYPEDELSSSDEDDDPTAIYRKYRTRGASDDEEYDVDDSDSDGGARFGQWRHSSAYVNSDDESD